jgi:bifunctional non-homologous end joining protein LigD
MPASSNRPTPDVRGDLEAHLRSATEGVLAYIPKRRVPAAAPGPRDLTLQAGFIPPCLPMTAPAPPSGDLWLHELKLDGIRIIARNDGALVRLYGRSGDDLTQRYPLIVETMARLPGCTIDGEAIALDDSGVASFHLLQHRLRDDRVCLHAFDLIELAGRDRRRDALADRKADLGRLIADAGPGVLPIEWVDGGECEGPALFEEACSQGLEGIVSKRKDSRYVAGRSPYWLKMDNPAHEARERQ